MATINDIAKEAKVSVGTVDRVIHNRGGVSKKTAAKVKAIIEKQDFRVNVIASSLALNKKFEIATLLPEFDTENTFWESPLLGIKKAADEVLRFGVKVNPYTFDQFDLETYKNEFKKIIESKPDAVIFVPLFGKESKKIANELESKKIPYIFLNVNLEGCNNLSFIGQDSYMSGFLAGKLMHLALNEKRNTVAVMQTRINLDNNHAISDRIKGFESYFKTNKKIEILNVTIPDLDDKSILKNKMDEMFIKNPTISGIYVPNSRVFSFAKCVDVSKINTILIGFDGTDKNVSCLQDETVLFLLSQQPFKEGYEAIKTMTNYMIDKKQPLEKIYSPIEILTKENVEFSTDKN
jgi:LacI family transcriptional regulator